MPRHGRAYASRCPLLLDLNPERSMRKILLRSLWILSLSARAPFASFGRWEKPNSGDFKYPHMKRLDRGNPPKARGYRVYRKFERPVWDTLTDDMNRSMLLTVALVVRRSRRSTNMRPGSLFLIAHVPWFFMRVTTIFLGRGPRLPNRYQETLRNLWRSFTPTCPKPGFTTYRSSLPSAAGVTGEVPRNE